jgi:hypothetical protein
MEVRGVPFVGFWKRAWAAFSDALFFQLVAFLSVLAAFRSDYLAFIEVKFAAIASLAEGPIDFAAVWKLDTGSYGRVVGAFYFCVPLIATIGFWVARSATPGLFNGHSSADRRSAHGEETVCPAARTGPSGPESRRGDGQPSVADLLRPLRRLSTFGTEPDAIR